MAEHMAHTCHNSYTVKHNRRFTVQASPIIKQDPISKITNTRRACRVVQVVEHLPSKCEPMSSNPSTTNEKKKKKEYSSVCPPLNSFLSETTDLQIVSPDKQIICLSISQVHCRVVFFFKMGDIHLYLIQII
jgi:hypothetical protein